MNKDSRKGARRDRGKRISTRTPDLGYYFIVTDTKETEINYFNGFRDSIIEPLRDRIVIKVFKTTTKGMLKKCLEMIAIEPQYRIPWIVFDRDQIKNFDEIIFDAESHYINVGWSNPCIEIWLHAYFSDMPNCADSVKCVNNFSNAFQKQTKQEYDKADSDLYKKLCQFGNEKIAILTAKKRYKNNAKNKPSEMYSTTTLFRLIEEIKQKTDSAKQ